MLQVVPPPRGQCRTSPAAAGLISILARAKQLRSTITSSKTKDHPALYPCGQRGAVRLLRGLINDHPPPGAGHRSKRAQPDWPPASVNSSACDLPEITSSTSRRVFMFSFLSTSFLSGCAITTPSLETTNARPVLPSLDSTVVLQRETMRTSTTRTATGLPMRRIR